MESFGNNKQPTDNNCTNVRRLQSNITTKEAVNKIRCGNCEHDAIHPRLLKNNEKQHDLVKCLSCKQIFKTTSFQEIVEHYAEVAHSNSLGKCHYCGGKVHQYKYFDEIRTYHSCSRWNQGIDK